MYEIRCSLATIVRTGATIWQHAVVKNGRTVAFFDTRSDAESYVRARS